jgi:chemotaxis protein MotB
MATRGGKRRRRPAADEQNEDRWLLTYADMITLLMALFMVLFSISSVNTTKFESLQRALNDAFSGRILPGGKSLQSHGGSETQRKAAPEPPIPALQPPLARPIHNQERDGAAAADGRREEQEDFRELKRRIDQYAREHGLREKVQTTISRRGLVIRLLTDRVLFDSGQAVLKPRAVPLLTHVGELLRLDKIHPVQVEGHTDNRPIASAAFPSNWELSTIRASTVVRFLLGRRVAGDRLSAAGFADEHPIATNGHESGRSRNRRVEIVLLRIGKANNVPRTKDSPAPRVEDSGPLADDPFEGIDRGLWRPVPADDPKVNP